MCGIAGRANLRSHAPVDAQAITAMCELISHRGPDGQGIWVEGPVGLGHRRLAIIDLSEGGRQPMSSPDRQVWVTFNGEIYNFLVLRKELESKGHQFRSHSDTEVLLAAYLEYGVDCLQHLRGMFAFAIWDARAQSLFVARDRIGKKPLFYWTDSDGLAFASEPKAFLGDPGFEPIPDYQAIGHYLSLQCVPSPYSAFRGVSKLPPAHYLLYRGGSVEVHRYWRLSYAQKLAISEEEACEELGDRLREAVRLRLISDVPLGAFLSGGIDSGTVVALMALESGAPVKTFSIGFDEDGFDELRYARLVADRYGTEHHEFVVRPEATDVLSDLVWHYNEPFADPSALPTYHLSRLTRQHVTVALNGDAGDENFAGYSRYVTRTRDAVWFSLPSTVRRLTSSMAGRLFDGGRTNSLSDKGKRWLQSRAGTQEAHYAERLMQIGPGLKASLCTPEFLDVAGNGSGGLLMTVLAASDGQDFLERALDLDVQMYLPDALLVKVDIATMAVALEGRSPFLDHQVMEFAASLPSHFKLRNGVTKYLLKRTAAALLPPEILNRPKKGFGVPLAHWFRTELRGLLHDVLLSERALQRGIFRREAVTKLITEHEAGFADWHDQLWNLLMLELWFQRFIDQRA